MALVTTTSVSAGRLRPFVKSEDPRAPFGEILFANVFTVPLKDALDESQVIISCTFPRNYVYRLQSMEVQIAGPVTADLTDREPLAAVAITENQVITRRFPMFNIATNGAINGWGYKIAPDATTNDFATYFVPGGRDFTGTHIADQLIDASQGSSIMTFTSIDSSNDDTAAVIFAFRFLATIYTVQQFNAAPINTPAWTVD